MKQSQDIRDKFTKYEIARVIGARALQIAMDAPLLLKLSDAELKEMKYDSIRIAEAEFESGVLPIAINRPTPQKRKDKLTAVKEEKVSDEEIMAKEQEVEKEIVEDAAELGLVATDEAEEITDNSATTSEEA